MRKKGSIMCHTIRLVPLLVVLPLLGCVKSEAPPEPAERGRVPAVRSAECRWATGPIQIDGQANEAAWQQAQALQDFAVYWQNRQPKTGTKARLLWDDRYFYFTAEMEDND